MSANERIQEMLRLAGSDNRLFPATILYNEGWLLRLVLDWFARQSGSDHVLNFAPGARWFSEALLPSQFFAENRNDRLAEGPTHADAVIGHVVIGDSAIADTKLASQATQFVVTEAKLFSPLSSGVTNATYFDQAARNVACIAEVLRRAERRPIQLHSLGFFVLAPSEQIASGVFKGKVSVGSMRENVSRRVSEYPSPQRTEKEKWLRDWFAPTLEHMRVDTISWESILDHIRDRDVEIATELSEFYIRCREFNRVQVKDRF